MVSEFGVSQNWVLKVCCLQPARPLGASGEGRKHRHKGRVSQKMASEGLPQASSSTLIHHLASGLDKPQEQPEPGDQQSQSLP